ncbi:phosphatidylinositol 4,5-bisphosphate 3-kinase catalytic subunit delta isoform-like [Uloborus diversus]|uniref:phosphatidylinositol 4,5-bisphosphate 3-kinase catalytic subunit delta isoform-like n=1 Tax=Uloborus diversus TaxID=327109 RepID=UPI00240A2EA9|nr:phosphatidylinositol 4,5-bisphosphate 3-kinase catalytic subunit delta isoform-like [Uloborus diversus]
MALDRPSYIKMESSCVVPDIWDWDDEGTVVVDVFLPNGIFLDLNVRKDATLHEIKEEVWEAARQKPLFGLLRDSESYVFQCVNPVTAQRDELLDENRLLSEVRPFQALLRLLERKGDKKEKKLLASLRVVIGSDIREYDESNISEVQDFRRQMKLFCESVVMLLQQEDSSSLEKRVLRQYPVALEANPGLPQYLQNKLEATNGKLVFSISYEHQGSETKYKVSVPPEFDSTALFDHFLKMKGPSLCLQGNKDYLLKICGQEEYIIGPYALSQYKYVQDSLSCDKIPELVLVTSDRIQRKRLIIKTEKKIKQRQRSRSVSNGHASLSRRRQIPTVSTWSIDEPLMLKIHHVHRFHYESKIRIAVQCGIFHSDEILSNLVHTSDKFVEDGKATWEETLQFDLKLHNVPRMAKLCICIYEVSPTQKNARFRKFEEAYACPIAWVNTPVFDYRGHLKCAQATLCTWPYRLESDEQPTMMLKPLGFVVGNHIKDQSSALTISFDRYNQTEQIAYPHLQEILEYVKEDGENNASSSSSDMPQASKSHLEQLRQICDKDTLYQLHEQEKELMWFLRNDCCSHLPHSLPKLLRCIKWNDRRETAQMTALLQRWPRLTPYKALELLDYAYPEPMVRSFAVDCLRLIPDEELSLFMLQLVQALKHEPYLLNDLTKFLLERALLHRHNGHRLFWLLRSEIHCASVFMRFSLILETYCRSVPRHLDALEKQVEALHKLKAANRIVQNDFNFKKDGREKLKYIMQDLLAKGLYQTLFKGLQNPLDPRFKFGRLRVEKCKFLDSKMKPLWLAFENTDNHGKDVFIIFKNGDDLRQDMLTLQMIRIMDRLWKDEGLDLRMIPYQCMATGNKMGLIEVVPDADTIANIQKEKGITVTSAFKKGSILSWLKDHNPDESSLSKATEEFTMSCAGYCVATYVLGIADRHSDNIMIKKNGQLFHVDFGHILGKFKEKFGFKRERVPFVLTHDFVYIITKGQNPRSQEFFRFQQFCENAFLILRRKGPLVISLFAMMLSTGIPELSNEKDLDYLRDTLVLDMSEAEALKHFRSKFVEALKNSWKTSLNWIAHNLAKDNKMSD